MSPVVIPTVVPLIAVIVIAVVPIVIPVRFSAVVPATAAAMLVTVGRYNTAAQQHDRSGKHHRNGFHRSLLSDLGLHSEYALRYSPNVSNGFRESVVLA